MDQILAAAQFVGIKGAAFGLAGWAVGAYGKAALGWVMKAAAGRLNKAGDELKG